MSWHELCRRTRPGLRFGAKLAGLLVAACAHEPPPTAAPAGAVGASPPQALKQSAARPADCQVRAILSYNRLAEAYERVRRGGPGDPRLRAFEARLLDLHGDVAALQPGLPQCEAQQQRISRAGQELGEIAGLAISTVPPAAEVSQLVPGSGCAAVNLRRYGDLAEDYGRTARPAGLNSANAEGLRVMGERLSELRAGLDDASIDATDCVLLPVRLAFDRAELTSLQLIAAPPLAAGVARAPLPELPPLFSARAELLRLRPPRIPAPQAAAPAGAAPAAPQRQAGTETRADLGERLAQECMGQTRRSHAAAVLAFDNAQHRGAIDPAEAARFGAADARLRALARWLTQDGLGVGDCMRVADAVRDERAVLAGLLSARDPELAECRAQARHAHDAILLDYQGLQRQGRIGATEVSRYHVMETRLRESYSTLARDGLALPDCLRQRAAIELEGRIVRSLVGPAPAALNECRARSELIHADTGALFKGLRARGRPDPGQTQRYREAQEGFLKLRAVLGSDGLTLDDCRRIEAEAQRLRSMTLEWLESAPRQVPGARPPATPPWR